MTDQQLTAKYRNERIILNNTRSVEVEVALEPTGDAFMIPPKTTYEVEISTPKDKVSVVQIDFEAFPDESYPGIRIWFTGMESGVFHNGAKIR